MTECVVERFEAKGLALRFVETDGLHLGDDPHVNVTHFPSELYGGVVNFC